MKFNDRAGNPFWLAEGAYDDDGPDEADPETFDDRAVEAAWSPYPAFGGES